MHDLFLYSLICTVFYMVLKFMVRWVWYRPEHLRPGFLRHYFVIRALDFSAMIFFAATFFMLVNAENWPFQLGIAERWPRTILVLGGLVLYDVLLRAFFLHLEARKICVRSPRWSMKDAKRRLRRRARQETPF